MLANALSASALRLDLDTVVWDNHACMPLRPDDVSFLNRLDMVRTSGVDVISINVASGRDDFASAMRMLGALRAWVQARSADYMLVERAADAQTAKQTRRLGVCFDVEGGDALGGDLRNIEKLHSLGVRWMLPCYNVANALGGGCLARDDGLTLFGRRAIAELNRLGMVVCASHCGYRTASDLIETSTSPVIFSHSNPRAVWDHPRNIPDDLMRACAERGGVVGINGFGPFLGPNDASLDTFVRHVEYAMELIGPDHVGIALDYVFDIEDFDSAIRADPVSFPPNLYSTHAQMISPAQLPLVHKRLSARGHNAGDLAKVFGLNHMRIARAVWAA